MNISTTNPRGARCRCEEKATIPAVLELAEFMVRQSLTDRRLVAELHS